MSPRRIDVRIERLVLYGLPALSGPETASGLQRELERRFAQTGAVDNLIRSADTHRVDGGRLSVAPGAEGAKLGELVGRRIAERLG